LRAPATHTDSDSLQQGFAIGETGSEGGLQGNNFKLLMSAEGQVTPFGNRSVNGRPVITAAGADERVAALVYICAFAPEEGDTTLC
jgi:hypothetical protein